MNNARKELLKKYLEENPNDPFPIYGLGLEEVKSSPEKALEYFEQLLKNFSDYLPTYYQAGKTYEALGNIEQAIITYKKGIELGKSQGDMHTVSELKGALAWIDDEDDDEF